MTTTSTSTADTTKRQKVFLTFDFPSGGEYYVDAVTRCLLEELLAMSVSSEVVYRGFTKMVSMIATMSRGQEKSKHEICEIVHRAVNFCIPGQDLAKVKSLIIYREGDYD